MHALHRYRCRWAWVSSKPSRTTVPLPQAGQSTPFGQRCWRTRAKHLASSISAERLTRSATAILEGPHAGWPARAVLADYHRGPAGTLPRPPPTTPESNKSHAGLREFRRRPDAAVERIDLAQQPLGDAVEQFGRDLAHIARG